MQRSTMTLLVAVAMAVGCQSGRQEERSEARLSDAARPAESGPQNPPLEEATPANGREMGAGAAEHVPAEPVRSAATSRSDRGASSQSAPSVATRPATPEPTPTPLPPVEVPSGTQLAIKLQTPVSSAKSQAGDRVVAEVTESVRIGSRVAIPAGSELHGRVTAAVGAGRVKGRARLAFTFGELVVHGRPHDVDVRPIDITAKSEKKKDAAMVGGGAGLGAVVGAIAGGKKGAAIGAAVGAGAGGGAAMGSKGKEVEMGVGYRLQVRLTESLTLP